VPDVYLTLAPLLVLVVVLGLGFAGCTFHEGVLPPDTPPRPTLSFRVSVDATLTALGGVTFRWRRPQQTSLEQVTVTAFTPTGSINVFEFTVPSPEPGSWEVECEIVAEGDGKQEVRTSGLIGFTLPDSGAWRYSFFASGIPLHNFAITGNGLEGA
jgi:hypothetical protein